ncbi:alpha/beta fold hydrolase [Streptomyces pseudovenezuelae]|uniref:alpha/beta fold hydrolase n=1 Tax=Streptomyces pseudovenezuelae TaxID=67350 RepID=UPI0036E22C73
MAETGEGPPLVLLHGGGPGASGVSNYARNIAALAKEYRVVVPDLPGYGPSSKGIDRADPFGEVADRIRGLLDRLGLDKAHFIGNSLGGACALRLPGHPRPGRPDDPHGPRRPRRHPRAAHPRTQQPARLLHGEGAFTAEAGEVHPQHQDSIDPEVVAAPPLKRPKSLKTLWKMDATRDARLSRLPVPTLVLWGAADKVNKPSGGPMLADRMPNCDLYMVADTGHWVQFERAELFNRLCADFLAGRG